MSGTQSERTTVDRACRFRRISGAGFRLVFEITRRCNFRCRHCFIRPDESHPNGEDIIRLIHEAAAAGCRKLILTGGEPLIRNDLETIVTEAVAAGVLADLNSNLYLLSAKRARSLKKAGLQEASVSFYGSEAVHDRLTGCKGSFARTLENMEHLRQVGIEVDVHGAVWDAMLDTIGPLIEKLQQCGVASVTFFSILEDRQSGCRSAYPLEARPAIDVIEKIRNKAAIPIRTVGLPPLDKGECVMGAGIYGLGAELFLRPCLLSRSDNPGIDVRPMSFQDARKEIDAQVRNGTWQPACCRDATERGKPC